MASDYGLWVEAEIEDPAVAVLGNRDSNNVGGVGGSAGVWAMHWVAGVGAGREAVTHRRLGYRLCVCVCGVEGVGGQRV